MEILVTNRKDRVLHFFLDNPTKEVHLWELSRLVGISFPLVRKIILLLVKEKLLLQRKEHGLVLIKANRENNIFLALKRSSNFFTLYQSGLVAELIDIYQRRGTLVLVEEAKEIILFAKQLLPRLQKEFEKRKG